MKRFQERFGPWALIAGASEGLGEAFARALAAKGLKLLLIARRKDALDDLARELAGAHGIEVRVLAADLARPDLHDAVEGFIGGAEVGLLVYNAGLSTRGAFIDQPLQSHLLAVEVNCRGPVVLAHLLGGAMARRGRGGIVLMTSLAGSQGGPLLATYAASKAFNLVLAESLWAELRERGVDVVACRAGAIRTPGYLASRPKVDAGPVATPEAVAASALAALGRGPSVVPGWLNRFAAFLLGRLLPRRLSIRIMGNAVRRMYG